MAKKLTEEDFEAAFTMAAKGAGRTMIAQALRINPRSTYKGRLNETIMEGYRVAREAVLSSYIEMAATEPGMVEKLARNLRVFHNPIPLQKPESATEVPRLLTDALQLWADGVITDNQLTVTQHWAEKYLRSVETADLEKRLDEIEARLAGCNDGHL